MGDPRGAPRFGQVDLEIEDDPSGLVRTAPESTESAFGELDFDLGDDVAEPAPPPSTSRVFGPDAHRHPTRKNLASVMPPSIHDESTRIVSGDALSAITRPPPAFPVAEDGNTRAWDAIDDALLSVGEESPAPPSSRKAEASGSGSGSGVASHDGRVAAMRELYARGDADGALALAASLGDSLVPGMSDHSGDRPDASIFVEFGEASIDLSDPFGGLIPIDDELAAISTVVPPAVPTRHAAQAAPPASTLTLTERQSIPRVLKSMGEVSKLKIDHRAGFLLAHVDGMNTLEEILDICAMPSTEALSLISNLEEMGVIEFE